MSSCYLIAKNNIYLLKKYKFADDMRLESITLRYVQD
jgi:hypothetical protein